MTVTGALLHALPVIEIDERIERDLRREASERHCEKPTRLSRSWVLTCREVGASTGAVSEELPRGPNGAGSRRAAFFCLAEHGFVLVTPMCCGFSNKRMYELESSGARVRSSVSC